MIPLKIHISKFEKTIGIIKKKCSFKKILVSFSIVNFLMSAIVIAVSQILLGLTIPLFRSKVVQIYSFTEVLTPCSRPTSPRPSSSTRNSA